MTSTREMREAAKKFLFHKRTAATIAVTIVRPSSDDLEETMNLEALSDILCRIM
jgi:hypothetical protein